MNMGTLPQISFQEWKYLDMHLVWIYEGAPRTSGKTTAHTDHVTAWYLSAGRVEVILDEVRTVAVKGDWLLLPPGQHDRIFSEDACILSLHFNARWITGQQLFSFESALLLSPELTRGWLKLCRPMLQLVRQCYPDAYNKLPAEHATFDQYTSLNTDFQFWLRRVLDALRTYGVEIFLPQTRDSRVLGMVRWLDALSVQHPFRMSAMATAFGLSAAQVNRLFCADVGITPKRYFESRRLKFAQAALASTGQAIKEISYQAGFRHQSEFTAWFKKYMGKSPSGYRESESSF